MIITKATLVLGLAQCLSFIIISNYLTLLSPVGQIFDYTCTKQYKREATWNLTISIN